MEPAGFEAAYFDTNYSDYLAQNPLRKMQYYQHVIERNLTPGVPRRIHDIGCAFGRFLSTLDDCWEICGSDVSRTAIVQAAEVIPRGLFKVAAASEEAVFPGKFGIVTAFDVIEHASDLDAIAQAVTNQLVEDGCFIFVVPVYDGLSGPIIRRLDRDPTHIHKWPRRLWIDWAQSHFHVIEWHGILRYLLPFRYYLHVPLELFKNHLPAIMVVCRK